MWNTSTYFTRNIFAQLKYTKPMAHITTDSPLLISTFVVTRPDYTQELPVIPHLVGVYRK